MLRSPAVPPRIVSVTWDAISNKPSSFPPAPHAHAWGEITNKPTAYTPASHTHPISDVSGLQIALDGKQVAGSYVTTANFTWANLGGKPTTFPPSAHSHLWIDITDKPASFPPSTHTHSYNDLTDKPTIPAAVTFSATPGAADTANGTPGSANTAARGDHTHPLPAGRQVPIGNSGISKTIGLALSAGRIREDVTLSGITTADQGKIAWSPITPCSAGCAVINVYVKAANTLTIEYDTPALLIGAQISLPIAVYRIV